MTTAAIGWLAAAASMSLLWPQVWLSCARKRTNGLSPTATWLGATTPVGWLAYGLLVDDRVQIATNLVTGTAAAAILLALLATQPPARRRRALVAAGWPSLVLVLVIVGTSAAAGAAVVTSTAAAELLGVVLAVSGLVSSLPQPMALMRRGDRNMSGLSPARWWLGLCSGSLWTVYGVAIGQFAVWASAVFGLACTSVVCAYIVRAGRGSVATARLPAGNTPATPIAALTSATGDYRLLALTTAA